MNVRQRRKLFAGAGVISMLFGAFIVVAPVAGAGNGTFEDGGHKVQICHRTNSPSNPYVMPSVDIDAADGVGGGGGRADHLDEHLGPVFDFSAPESYSTPRNGDQWGDIIPPVPLFDAERNQTGMTTGLNWYVDNDPTKGPNVTGQEIYENGCNEPDQQATRPVVVVEKQVPNDDVAEPFNFSVNRSTPATEIADGGSEDFTVVAGDVTVTEDLTNPGGYELTDVTCTRVSSAFPDGVDLEVDEVDGAVTFSIGNDEVVTCVFTNVPEEPTGTALISILKTNDANGDGLYGENEQTASGATVPFRLIITNKGDEALNVVSLLDTWPADELDLLDAESDLTCTTPGEGEPVPFHLGTDLLQPEVPVTCDFSVENYITGAGASITNTVTLDTDKTEPVSDTSTVTTPQPSSCVDCGGSNPTYSVVVDKVNDANGDGTFTNSETAGAAGDDVAFQVTIRNTGTGLLTLQRLTDQFRGRTIDLLGSDVELDCGGVDLTGGFALVAGSTTVCTFTLDEYAPAAGTSIVNTVTVDTDRADAADTSRVRSPRTEVLPEQQERPPAPTPPGPPAPTPPQIQPEQAQRPAVLGVQTTRQLPRTGSESENLAGFGAGFLLLGVGLVITSRARRYGIAD